jgi:hypothetical protein
MFEIDHANIFSTPTRMNAETPLHQRRRPPTPAELAGIPWLAAMTEAEQALAVPRIVVGDASPATWCAALAKRPPTGLGWSRACSK